MVQLYKCIPVEHGVEIATSPVTFFTYRIAAHLVTDLGSNRLRITRLIDGGTEIYDEPVTSFIGLDGQPIATTFADFLIFLHTDIAKLRAGVGTAVANNVIDLLIGGPDTLGGYKVGTGLNVDGDGRLSATASSEVTQIVSSQDEMLALPLGAQPYRVVRVDEQRLYFLNANVSPSVFVNWVVGPSITAAVNSFNTRTGDVLPANGDYNFDMLTLQDKTNAGMNTLVLDDGVFFIQSTDGTRKALAYKDNADLNAQLLALESKADSAALSIVTLKGSDNTQNIAIAALNDKNTVQDTRLTAIDAALINKANLVDGKVPYSALPALPTGRKLKVDNRAARLALPAYTDLTIAYESDTGNAFALNANDNPAIASNWSPLGNAQAMGVVSFNGRTGNIGPQANDYNTDQIAETLTKRFITSDQAATWDAKETPTGAQTKATAVKTYADETFLTKDQRGVNNGVAPLGADGIVPAENLPPQTSGGGGEWIVPVTVYTDVKALRVKSTWYTNTGAYDKRVRITTNWIAGKEASFIHVRDTSGTVYILQSDDVSNNVVYSQILEAVVPAGWSYQLVLATATARAVATWLEFNTVAGSTFTPVSEKGKASGVAPLDASSRVPLANLPTFLPQSKRTWRDAKASRAYNTWATNASGNEMELFIRTNALTDVAKYIIVDMRETPTSGVMSFACTTDNATGTRYLAFQVTVPEGWQFSVRIQGGAVASDMGAISIWRELR